MNTDAERHFVDEDTGYEFDWWFNENDLKADKTSKTAFNVVKYVEVKSPYGNNYIVDILKEDHDYALKIYELNDDYSHGDFVDTTKGIKTAKTIKSFKTRAQNLIEVFIDRHELATLKPAWK